MVTTVLAGIVMLGVLVFIHEFGHFVVAKIFRVGVPVFSFGMGPRLLGFHWRGTDYRLSAIPVGGYVRMSGADPFGEEDPDAWVEPEQDFMRKSVWARLLIMLAGPAFNLALPVVLFAGVVMLGEPQADSSVGAVLDDTPAAAAGFQDDDRVLDIAGEPMRTWADVVTALHSRAGEEIALEVERGEAVLTLTLPAGAIRLTDDDKIDMEEVGLWSRRRSTRVGVDGPGTAAATAGLATGDAIVAVDGVEVTTWAELMGALEGEEHVIRYKRAGQEGEVVEAEATLAAPDHWIPRPGDPMANRWGLVPAMLHVGKVAGESPALAAGVLPDDRILAVDGTYLTEWAHLTALVKATAEEYAPGVAPRRLDLVVVRDGEVITHRFAPRMQREIILGEVRYRPIMGIHQYPDAFVDGPEVQVFYGPVEATSRAFKETGFLFTQTMGILGKLLTGEIKANESLGGPVEIFRMAGEGAKRGIFSYVRLVGTISISLGILNLLPVPVLDGGHIFFYLIEAVRGRPLSLVLRERLQMVGVLALVLLMLLVTANDVTAWITGGR